jgi:hypothetical protein
MSMLHTHIPRCSKNPAKAYVIRIYGECTAFKKAGGTALQAAFLVLLISK